jgi:hypothetical protein
MRAGVEVMRRWAVLARAAAELDWPTRVQDLLEDEIYLRNFAAVDLASGGIKRPGSSRRWRT